MNHADSRYGTHGLIHQSHININLELLIYTTLHIEGKNVTNIQTFITTTIWRGWALAPLSSNGFLLDMLACAKECLRRYRGMLQLVHQDSPKIFQNSSLQMVSQAQNQLANSMRKNFSKQIYDDDSVYSSPLQIWIEKACESNPSP